MTGNSLFVITNGMYGESYVRCYAWAESEDHARQMYEAKHPGERIGDCDELFRFDDAAFITEMSDCGFEFSEPASDTTEPSNEHG